MRPVSAVVFDLDGTLIDSVPDIAAALNTCLAAEGRPALDDTDVAKLVGGGARELIARAFSNSAANADIDRILDRFIAGYEAEPVRLTRLYPGAMELLTWLKDRGLPLAICTNKPQALTDIIVKRLALAPYFSVVWGAATGRPLKPDASCLRTLCEALGTPPDKTVMVGDSRADVDAARAAGCRSILVGHGYEQHPLASLGADSVAADLAAVGRIIAGWIGENDLPLQQPA